jgi:hypothetical protein
MIISASYRTDIPAFHGAWFNQRLDAGFCTVKNPYSNKISRVALNPCAVDGFVFWTRRLGGFMTTLDRMSDRGTPFVIQFTVTGYPKALEPAVVDWRRAVDEIHEATSRHGPRAVVWRYDPVFLSDITPASFHIDRIAEIAEQLAGATDEVALSFAHLYRKTRKNTERAAARHRFSWADPDVDEKRSLLATLSDTVSRQDIEATLCAQPDLLTPSLRPARCIDSDRLSDVAGRPVTSRQKGNRPGCLCAESRDIGAYDTCSHGCVYCYAVSSRDAAKQRIRALSPSSEGLHPSDA